MFPTEQRYRNSTGNLYTLTHEESHIAFSFLQNRRATAIDMWGSHAQAAPLAELVAKKIKILRILLSCLNVQVIGETIGIING